MLSWYSGMRVQSKIGLFSWTTNRMANFLTDRIFVDTGDKRHVWAGLSTSEKENLPGRKGGHDDINLFLISMARDMINSHHSASNDCCCMLSTTEPGMAPKAVYVAHTFVDVFEITGIRLIFTIKIPWRNRSESFLEIPAYHVWHFKVTLYFTNKKPPRFLSITIIYR